MTATIPESTAVVPPEPFQVTVGWHTGTCRVIGEFRTYREARRACRRAMLKYYRGLFDLMPEVTRISGRCYANLAQPHSCNYGKETFNEDGYLVQFDAIKFTH